MASVQGETSSPLRLFVDKERNRVVVGEASGDFIDALLSFLTLPLGTIVRLLSNEETHRSAEVGCINNLYRSVQNFKTEGFWNQICKKLLLSPRNPCEKLSQKLRFNVDDTEPTKYWMCRSCKGGGGNWLSTFVGVSCSTCGELMDKEMKLKGEKDYNTKGDGVFVSGNSMYLILDDLTFLQHSARNTVHQLVQLGYTDSTKLTEITPDVGLNQVMDLLKHALISTSPLTDVFLAQEGTSPRENHTLKGFPWNLGTQGNSPYVRLVTETGGSKPVSSFTPILDLQNENVDGSEYFSTIQITVCKSNNKIMYAEVGGDFADFLLSFLTMPLGSTFNLLGGIVSLGSVHNLYKSVKGLDLSLLRPYCSPDSSSSSPLLDLKVASQHGCDSLLLDGCERALLAVCEEEIPYYYYERYRYLNKGGYYVEAEEISKRYDKGRDASRLELFDPRCADGRREAAVGFVRRPSLFVVMDELEVLPMASASSVSFLQKLNAPLDDLEEREVKIGLTEALNLWGASLTSKAALTNGLSYLVKKPKKKDES